MPVLTSVEITMVTTNLKPPKAYLVLQIQCLSTLTE